ncbi:MAG: hypothetical protein ABIJ27_07880 [Candidatus Omnitrophota bacterium]
MKYPAAVLAVVAVLSVIPALANDGEKKETLFQKVGDSIQRADPPLSPVMKSEKHKFRPALQEVSTFQNASNYLKESSERAKKKSKRKKKQ